MTRIYPLRSKSERHLALDAHYPPEPWPACGKCDSGTGECVCPQACLKPDSRYDAEGRHSLQMLAVVLLAAVAFVATLSFWLGALA